MLMVGVLGVSMMQLHKLYKDVWDSLRIWRFWVHLGWEDVARQYRRSILGPIWITLNTGLFIFVFGLIGAQLFKSGVHEYLPYLCVGHVVFTYISLLINEGCQVFMQAEPYLKQAPFPKFAFIFRVVWRNVLLFAHNFPVVILVIGFTSGLGQIRLGWLLLGALALVYCSTLAVAILGLIAARFRDVPMIVTSVMQIAFFVTPVMWRPEQLTDRAQLAARLNPLAAILELIRAPMLGAMPSMAALGLVLVTLFVLSVLCLVLYVLGRRRIVYWI
ncbi:MAG: hypothetical protein EKK45_10850 [Curvibacter sp.]|nr:MAG: hypothetical protein EKK45_10850 [Curvibacter sp.]